MVSLIILCAIVAGGWYWYEHTSTAPATNPINDLGVNGSPNQGNLGDSDIGVPSQPQGSETDTTDREHPTLMAATDAKLGVILTASNGMTLYTFAKDTTNVSNCTGTCAANWPPYTVATAAQLSAPSDITGALGTITRADNTLQVTYKGAPLYFYVKDTKPGNVFGEGIGGVWSVVHP